MTAFHDRMFRSLREHRNYRLYFVGQIISISGAWIGDAALPWLAYELTHSGTKVGLLVFLRFAPSTVFGLVAGAFADRFDNRRFFMVTQAASIVPAALLAILTFSGSLQLWHLYALTLMTGIAFAFEAPVRHAFVYQLVGPSELSNAVALNSALNNSARIVGPATAGALIAVVGVGWCFVLNASTYLALLTVLALMRVSELFPVAHSAVAPKVLSGLREAAAYVRRSRTLLLVLLVAASMSLVGFNSRVLLPVLASNTLDASAGVFGLLYAVFGVGAVAGGLAAASLGRGSVKAVYVGAAGLSIGMLGIAPLRSVLGAALLLFAIGLLWSTWAAHTTAVVQLASPDELRGRVISFLMLAFAGLQPVGALLAGWLADVGGTELAFFASGICGLVLTTVAAVKQFAPDRRAAPAAAETIR
jgi:MFS family permease